MSQNKKKKLKVVHPASTVTAKRRHFTPSDKVTILRRHLVDRVAVSDLCDEYDLHPTLFYRWQKEFFENGEAAFKKQHSSEQKQAAERITQLEEKLSQKNEVVSELMEEHLRLKKSLGVL